MGQQEHTRYDAGALIQWVTALFESAQMPAERAAIVAKLLVEADLMGHNTHGLALAAHYLNHLDTGVMTRDGGYDVVNQRGPCETWDGNYLSGVWLTHEAIQRAIAHAREFGIGVITIQRSHHIACLATFLELATDQGFVVQLMSSDPAEGGVAPYGGVEGCFTPNPIAVGYPTHGDPVLIDVSASITTLGMSGRVRAEGGRMPGAWFIDANGNATDDPAVLVADPPGALLPLGGLDAGHKGYALALMVEALTSGLAGHGRRNEPDHQGASVFIQVFDPDAFGGGAALRDETTLLAERCRNARVPPGADPVRLPGDGALRRKRSALENGVSLYPGIMDGLAPWAQRYGHAAPGSV